MDIADVVMIAEDSWAERNERHEQALERDRQRLFDEFMQALSCPMFAHVSATKGRKYPVLECFFENLGFSKYRADAAMAVAILMRDPVGLEICKRMANVHATDYAEAGDE